MTRFDFLHVLASIVIAISMTDIARSWGALLKKREVVRFYWVHIAWSALILLLMAQLWWGMWIYRGVTDWSFFQTAAIVCELLLLGLVAAVITPSKYSDKPIDLEAFFYEVSPVFFTLGALLMLALALVNLIVAKQALLSLENVIRAIAISVAMFGATTRSTLAHTALVASGFVLLLIFVLMHAAR